MDGVVTRLKNGRLLELRGECPFKLEPINPDHFHSLTVEAINGENSVIVRTDKDEILLTKMETLEYYYRAPIEQ